MSSIALRPASTGPSCAPRTSPLSARFKKGVPSGAQAHYVAADGSQGVVILETDDLQEGYRNLLNYSEWIEYDTKPYLTLEQALPHISDYIS